jgi:hypothetical protein
VLTNLLRPKFYAARGGLIPFNSNAPTGSTFTAFSTFMSTHGLIGFDPSLASSQSREATIDTVPIAALAHQHHCLALLAPIHEQKPVVSYQRFPTPVRSYSLAVDSPPGVIAMYHAGRCNRHRTL